MSIPAFGFTRAGSTLFQQGHQAVPSLLEEEGATGHKSIYYPWTLILKITGENVDEKQQRSITLNED